MAITLCISAFFLSVCLCTGTLFPFSPWILPYLSVECFCLIWTHCTEQHRKSLDHIRAPSGTESHDHSVRAVQVRARWLNGIGFCLSRHGWSSDFNIGCHMNHENCFYLRWETWTALVVICTATTWKQAVKRKTRLWIESRFRNGRLGRLWSHPLVRWLLSSSAKPNHKLLTHDGTTALGVPSLFALQRDP